MSFRNLENRVEKEDTLSEFFDIFKPAGGLREPTRTVLGYTLDIATLLDAAGMQDDYALHGGYASLVHMMGVLRPNIAFTWRGSTDIDMYGTQEVINTLKGAYHVESDRKSPNLREKRTIKLTTIDPPAEPEVKIDFTLGRPKGETVERRILGVPLRVVPPERLIQHKLPVSKDEKQQIDIVNMLWVLEQEGVNPAEACKQFSTSEKGRLYSLLQSTRGIATNQRMNLAPSTIYLRTLVHYLKKYNNF